MTGGMLRVSFAAFTCAFGFLGCVMVLLRGPSTALLTIALKCADRV
jgi:hypothetical protein